MQYENDILHCLDGVVMLQVRNNKHKKVIPIDQLEALDVPHYPYTFVEFSPKSLPIVAHRCSTLFNVVNIPCHPNLLIMQLYR